MGRTGYLLPTENEPRVRRARNAVSATLGLVLLLAAGSTTIRVSALQDSIADVVGELPSWAELAFWIGYGATAVYCIGVVAALLVRARKNVAALRDVVLALVIAGVLATLLMKWVTGDWPLLLPEFGAEAPVRQFPIVRVSIVSATVLASVPHVTIALRRFGYAMILLVALAGFGLGFGFPADAVAAVGVGMIAAGSVLLLFGSPSGYPQPETVAAALRELGLEVHDLALAPDQSWGTRRFLGRGDDGVVIEVKAYGKDAVDTQVASTVWRAIWYRGSSSHEVLTRMRAVEHEALMALFAERSGVPSVDPLAAGRAGDDVAILAVRRPGTPLSEMAPEGVPDATLEAIWHDVGVLHDAGMAHGSLTTSAVLIEADGHRFDDYARGSIAAGDQRTVDVVELLFSLAAQLGTDRAVATAAAALGTERLAEVLPYLQLPALHSDSRKVVDKPKRAMEEIRLAVAEATDAEPPEPVELRRVTFGKIGMLALVLLAANALISQLTDIDYAAVWDIIQEASWVALLLAFPVAHLNFLAEAGSMMAAVGMPLPLRPLAILQVAARFIGLAVPSAAGRVAMNSAFLVKFGVSPAVAVVQGAIDGVSGFMVEAGILLLALIFSDLELGLEADVDWQLILLIAVLVVIIGAAVIFFVKSVREKVVPTLKEALGSLRSVLEDPQRALRLLGNNLLGRIMLGLTLYIILRAIGVTDIGLGRAVVVTVATNLLAGLVPIPGGIGVAEAVMTSWLVLAGVPEAEAFAATVMYRMWTFYLPAVEGFFAMKWLERRDYL